MRAGVRADFMADILRDFGSFQRRFARDAAAMNKIADALESVESLDGSLVLRRRSVEPGAWGYKRSPYQSASEVILRAVFRLVPGDPRAIDETMQRHREDRVAKGHFLHPCAGSVFKNDRSFGKPTGRLIDELGLKGLAVGGAQVAPFHGNIIVNLGHATAGDVRALIEHHLSHAQRRIRLTEEALRALENYRWPGNVRELQNVAAALAVRGAALDAAAVRALLDRPGPMLDLIRAGEPTLAQVEAEYTAYLLRKYRNKSRVARLLGVSRKSLYNMLKRHERH